MLYDFFSRLSERAKAYFGPHPLDLEFAGKATREIEPHKRPRLVATVDQPDVQRIIGYSFASLDPFSRKRAIGGTAILDEFQGQGVGSVLLESKLELMTRLGIEEVWGSVHQSNTRSRALTRKFGFRESPKPVALWFFALRLREGLYNYGFFGAIGEYLTRRLRRHVSSDRITWIMRRFDE